MQKIVKLQDDYFILDTRWTVKGTVNIGNAKWIQNFLQYS